MSNPNLFSTYTATNMITSQGLTVGYDQQYTPAQGDVPAYYTVTRYARKTYSFVGLTEEAAYECAAAKRAQYTRAYRRIDTSSGSPVDISLYCCAADVTPSHDNGCAWSVSVNVSETDVRHSAEVVEDLATFFASENGRNYDDTGAFAALTLDSASRSGTLATYEYTENLGPDFDSTRLIFQYKTADSAATWHSGTTVPESVALYVRLVYGQIESNTLTIAAEE